MERHPEYHGLTRCPFCGREKEASWLTCSRPSCEKEMIERETEQKDECPECGGAVSKGRATEKYGYVSCIDCQWYKRVDDGEYS